MRYEAHIAGGGWGRHPKRRWVQVRVLGIFKRLATNFKHPADPSLRPERAMLIHPSAGPVPPDPCEARRRTFRLAPVDFLNNASEATTFKPQALVHCSELYTGLPPGNSAKQKPQLETKGLHADTLHKDSFGKSFRCHNVMPSFL